MNDTLHQIPAPLEINIPKNEDHIPAEAFEFRFPSQTDKRNLLLKRLLIGFVAISAIVIFTSAMISKNAYFKELEIKLNDNLKVETVKFLNTAEPSPLVFMAETNTTDGQGGWKDSPYQTVLKNLAAQRYRYVILKETDVVGKGKIATGYYDTTNTTDFISQFHEGQQRVGYITEGSEGNSIIYLVIYNPQNIKVQQILDSVSAPGDENALAEFDITNFKEIVVKDLQDLEKQIITPKPAVVTEGS